MDTPTHTLSELFKQLGLPTDSAGIEQFILSHSPLPDEIPLADAPFWSPTQSTFLREAIAENADWAEVIELLNVLLRS